MTGNCRDCIQRHLSKYLDLFVDGANDVLMCICDQEGAVGNIWEAYCDHLDDVGEVLDNEDASSLAAFTERCLEELMAMGQDEPKVEEITLMPGYFTSGHHEAMRRIISVYVHAFSSALELYFRDEADAEHIVGLVLPACQDALQAEGCKADDSLKDALVDYILLGAVVTITAYSEV